jgi:tetraacyldisaccharide 4'-kinase
LRIKGIYFLYRFLQALALPLLILYFAFRGLRNRAYFRSLPERFGLLPHSISQTGPGAIWLHAVSVGEVMACIPFLRRLREAMPNTPVYVSTSTIAGYSAATEKLGELAAGVFHAPVDYVWAVRRVLRRIQPSVVVIAETEIWPNLFRETKRTGAGLILVNGRISDRALDRYVKYRWFFTAALSGVDVVLAQTDEIADRFVAIGAMRERVRAGGNFKYDFDARAAGRELLDHLQPGKIWIAASTMPPAEAGDVDEDDAVIAAIPRVDATLILAPRKPERFDVVARKLEAAGIEYVRRSLGGTCIQPVRVLLLDTIGELSGLFAYADVIFMGGTLARRGGHNILEPALFGKPVIIGPHMENFRAIADDFRAAGACLEIDKPDDLADAVERLLRDPGEIGAKAQACAEARRGAAARAVAEVHELYASHIARRRPPLPWLPMLWALAQLWRLGGRSRRSRTLRAQRRLAVPVISVGNLTMGGTGKTPCVLRLAALLKERGRKPGILTRGYGRSSPEKQMALAPGADVHADQTGDEPQIFVRSGLAPVGIGTDRFETGTLLLRGFNIDCVLLDDGFQHARLARDMDIVLIDAINPFAGGDVFPLGRLREPRDALVRADVVLITRSDLADTADAIERELRRWNSHAPIFHARVRPEAWVEYRSGQVIPIGEQPFRNAAAFCGLGNPQSFRRTLAQIGITPAEWVEYEDHHRYRPQELRHIAHHAAENGADALVTTEKDTFNICEGCEDLLSPLALYWLKVGMTIEREQEFLDLITRF